MASVTRAEGERIATGWEKKSPTSPDLHDIEFENGAARYRMGSHSLRGAGILVEGLVSDPVRIWTKGFKSKHWN